MPVGRTGSAWVRDGGGGNTAAGSRPALSVVLTTDDAALRNRLARVGVATPIAAAERETEAEAAEARFEMRNELGLELSKYMLFLHWLALEQPGTEARRTALEVLQGLAKWQVTFDFVAWEQEMEGRFRHGTGEESAARHMIARRRRVLPLNRWRGWTSRSPRPGRGAG